MLARSKAISAVTRLGNFLTVSIILLNSMGLFPTKRMLTESCREVIFCFSCTMTNVQIRFKHNLQAKGYFRPLHIMFQDSL